MNYHIVRTNETIEKIALIYNLTINEIKNINTHVRSWSYLIPGTRLKLPPIPESINEEINDVEPFIEDYYPRIDLSKYSSSKETPKESNDIVESKEIYEINQITDNSEKNEKIENNSQVYKNVISNKINLPKYPDMYNPYRGYPYFRKPKKKK